MSTLNKHYIDAPVIYRPYLDLVSAGNIKDALAGSMEETVRLFAGLSPDKADYAYAPGKWTVKEVLRHIIDCEHVYTYRSLRLSRFDATPIAGFDENAYAAAARPVGVGMEELLEEFRYVRLAGICLFGQMTGEMLDFKGTVNGLPMTAQVLGFLTAGHNLHHCNVIRHKYL